MSDPIPNLLVVIPAGGSGSRLGGERKQFRSLGDYPVIIHTLRKFDTHPMVRAIAVAAPRDDIDKWIQAIRDYRFKKVRSVVAGGETRQASVFNGLKVFRKKENMIVMIHDAVRPFVSHELISEVAAAAEEHGAAAPVLESVDTVRLKDGDFLGETLNRTEIVHMQTPQAFKYKTIISAHENHEGEPVTDDVALVQASGQKVKWVVGEKQNFKITNPEDWEAAVHMVEV